MVKKTRTILSNGLSIVVVEIPDSKSLVTSFWSKAGSRYDPEDKAGMSHFLEHLLIKKTKKHSTEEKLAKVLEIVGAFKNGMTHKDSMNLNISSAAKDYELTLRILSEMVFEPLIDKNGFDAERKVIFQEQARSYSMPEDLVWDVWYRNFFAPSPLRHPVLGTKESLLDININEASKFWNDLFIANSSTLLIVGGIKFEQILKIAEKHFGSRKLSQSTNPPAYQYKSEARISFEKKMLPRANMLMSFRTFGGPVNKDTYALLALRGVLASGWASRISQRLRIKESLIYGFGSKLIRYSDTGALTLHLASSKEKFGKMISVLCEEIVRLRDKGISNKDLDLAKGFIEGSLLSGIETSWDYVNWYAVDELHWPGKNKSPEETITQIKKVTKSQVEEIGKKYLTADNWHLAVVGDVKEKEIKVEL